MNRIIKVFIGLIIIFVIFVQTNMVNASPAIGVDGSGGSSSSSGSSGSSGTSGSSGSSGSSEKWTSKSAEWWIPSDGGPNDNEIVKRANIITTVIRTIGIICAVIALLAIGIKEMTSSIEEKSAIKQAMPGYLLGVFMIVAITAIPSLIYEFIKGIG